MSIDQELLSYSMEESQKDLQKHHAYEKDQDKNLFVVTKENIQHTSMSSENASSKTIAEQLIHAFQQFEDFVGSTYYKHQRLYRYYSMLCAALKDTSALIYPTIVGDTSMARQNSQESIDSDMAAAACKENV